MRVALVGFSQGYYAVEYTRYLSRLREAVITAVCDLGKDEAYVRSCAFVEAGVFAREMGAPLTHTLEETLATKPEAVLLCCETAEHTSLAEKVLAAGAHVFVSKPLCFSSAQADRLADVLPAGLKVVCGQPLRHEDGVRELLKRINEGEIGRIYSVRVRLCHEAMIHQAWERDSRLSGGPLGTYGVYLFDLAHAFSGVKLDRLYAVGQNAATAEIKDMDTVKILAVGGRIQFSLELFSAVGTPMPFLHAEIVGERGMLETGYENPATVARMSVGTKPGMLRTSDMTRGEMEHFLACVSGKCQPCCGVEDMRYITRCIEATRESIRLETPVMVRKVERP